MGVLVKGAPCVAHEDEHLLVVNKPAGLNTHSPSPYAGEGIYDWLRNREERWANLGIIHRLDKSTSGVMVFPKTKQANRILGDQFAHRKVHKRYLFLSDRPPRERSLTVQCALTRAGEKYVPAPKGDFAITKFTWLGELSGYQLWAAEPVTGRTHQIRVHAGMKGFPILGDTLYGGKEFARVCLHAEEISFAHPMGSSPARFRVEPDFFSDPALPLRNAIIDPATTDALRLINGAADGRPGLYVEQWASWLLANSESNLPSDWINQLPSQNAAGVYLKRLDRHVRKSTVESAAPVLARGEAAPERFVIRENGVQYEASFTQGYSTGLFLDQRDNRRRILTNWVGRDFELFPGSGKDRKVLNTFAYTCAFSVCAALAGATTTSLDLSKKYLDWGKKNFQLNGLDPERHDFIFGDVFDWAGRLIKRGAKFDLIILDPPTFSQSKGSAPFQAERDYGKLLSLVLPLLNPGGVLLASTNAHKLRPEAFMEMIHNTLSRAGKKLVQSLFVPQPIDFPANREEPPYLKTVWLRIQ